MKKKNKEVQILFLLLAVLFLYGFYVFLLTPLREENKSLENEITTKQTVLQGIYNTAANYETNIVQLRQNCEQAQAYTDRFYIGSDQETYLTELRRLMEESSLTFSEVRSAEHVRTFLENGLYETSNPYSVYVDDAVTKNESSSKQVSRSIMSMEPEKAVSIPVLRQMEISLEMDGTYGDAKTFLDTIEQHTRFIQCCDFAIDRAKDNSAPEEGSDPVSMTVDLVFLKLDNISPLEQAMQIPEDLPGFRIPEEFASGEYRNLYSAKNIQTALEALLRAVWPFR